MGWSQGAVVPPLLHWTIVPAATLRVSGENWYSSMLTLAPGGGLPPPPVGLEPPQAVANTTVNTRLRARMTYLPG